jgi:hypothetical protein
MGGPSAPTDLATGAATQVWLATSDEPAALVTGRYWRHMNLLEAPPGTQNADLQDGLLSACARLSGVPIPDAAATQPADAAGRLAEEKER